MMLTVALIMLVFRAVHDATRMPLWDTGFGLPQPYMPLGGIVVLIVAVGGLLWLLSRRRDDGRW